MAAIAELLAAWIAFMTEGLAGLLLPACELMLMAGLSCIGWLAEICEFLVTCAVVGIRPAAEKRREARKTRLARLAARKAQQTAKRETSQSSRSSPEACVVLFVTITGVVAVIAWMGIDRRIREARIQTTRKLVQQCADQLMADQQQKQQLGQRLLPGLLKSDRKQLPAHDAWKQPLELFVDETPAGMLLVVRSSGPDRKTGTIDDLLEIRPITKNLQQMSNELIGGIADRIKAKLQGPPQVLPPQN